MVQCGRVGREGLRAGPPSGRTRQEGPFSSSRSGIEHHKADCLKSRLALGFAVLVSRDSTYSTYYRYLVRVLPTRVTAVTSFSLSLFPKQKARPITLPPLMTPMGSPGQVEPRAQTWRPSCTHSQERAGRLAHLRMHMGTLDNLSAPNHGSVSILSFVEIPAQHSGLSLAPAHPLRLAFHAA